jgi:hypothetical protein
MKKERVRQGDQHDSAERLERRKRKPKNRKQPEMFLQPAAQRVPDYRPGDLFSAAVTKLLA